MKDNNLEKKLPLLSGKGMWHTNDCDGKYPQLHLSDGPHGLRKQEENVRSNNDSYVSTCYPTASALAATWDRELVGKVADSIGKEAVNANVAVVLGPGINIKRSPLCGRNFEYFSEDPYLAGEMGTAFIEGVQKNGVGTSLKHFAANNQETRRMTSNSRVDERTLREIYLSAFESCVKNAKPATVMVSYNYLNGYKATENSHLMKDVLRDDWGYEGVTVSDWGACIDLAKSVKAGLDLEMPGLGKVHFEKLKKDIEAGNISEEDIKPAIGRLEKLIEKYSSAPKGSGSNPETNAQAVALEAALAGAVLLKNEDNVLPLKERGEINVIGELARTVRFQGGGSSHINTRPQPNVLDKLKDAGFDVHFAPGYRIDSGIEDETLAQEAEELVKNGLPTIFCGGLTDLAEGEGYDRKILDIPFNQLKLIDRLGSKEMIFLSFGGSPFAVPFLDKMKAMLHMYLGGEAVAKAAVMLLTGKANPSGKLAETWPEKISDTPAYDPELKESNEVYYKEGVLVGYRHYDTHDIKPLFPFGYGLSYTSFEYSELLLSTGSGNNCKVSFKVRNTGKTAGAEIAQIYVENPDDGYIRARHELREFRKVFLNPGEETKIELTLDERAFSVFDTKLMKFVASSGHYAVCVGGCIDHLPLRGMVAISGNNYAADPSGVDEPLFIGNEESDLDHIEPGKYSVYNSLGELSQKSFLGKVMMKLAIKIVYRTLKKPHDDPEVMMAVETIKDGPIDCIILQSGGVPYGIANAIVKQANKNRG